MRSELRLLFGLDREDGSGRDDLNLDFRFGRDDLDIQFFNSDSPDGRSNPARLRFRGPLKLGCFQKPNLCVLMGDLGVVGSEGESGSGEEGLSEGKEEKFHDVH